MLAIAGLCGPQQKEQQNEQQKVRALGRHLIVELRDADQIDCPEHVRSSFVRAVEASGATLLSIHLHRFTPQGVSGVAILAESHISIHSWPERRYAALDVFMCGDADPYAAAYSLKKSLGARRMSIIEIRRGVIDEASPNEVNPEEASPEEIDSAPWSRS